jgi:hypothetical protein
MVEINPKRITGCWTEGFALDFHTLSRIFLDNEDRERFLEILLD